MAKKLYKKLGKKKTLISSTSLWQSDNHLLYCEYVGFEESYKRFRYKDIQGITITKNNYSRVITLVLFLLFAALYYLLWQSQWQYIPLVVLLMIHCLAILLNIFKGDTCTTYIQTAVQQTNLRPLNRVKKVNRFLKRIRPFIQASQGDLTPELLEEKYASIAAFETSKPITTEQPKPTGFQKSPFHPATFGLLIGVGLIELLDYYINHVGITAASSILGTIFIIVGIIALVQQTQLHIKPAVKTVTWITLGYACIMFGLGYAMMIIISINAAQAGNAEIFENRNSWAFLKLLSEVSPEDSAFMKICSLISIYGSLILGSLGLFTYFGRRASDAK